MRVHVADHPLITHKLTVLRDRETKSPTFRALTEELVTLLAYEATRNVRTETIDIDHARSAPTKGLGHFEAASAHRADPARRARHARGHDEARSRRRRSGSSAWCVTKRPCSRPPTPKRLPDDLSNRQCFVLDPMLATGGSLIAAIDFLLDRGAVDVTAVCILASPEGLAAVEKAMHGREVTIVLGAVDEKLNENGYIVPGLGDAGDRLYGLA